MKLFKNKFFTSTFILMLSGLSTKVLGLVIKVIFTRIVGSTTISLYTIVMPTYSLLLTIGTFAMPTTIAKLIAQNKDKRVLNNALNIILVLNILLIIIMFIVSPFIANSLLKEPKTYYLLIAMALTLPFSSIACIFKGYFYGIQKNYPHVLSNTVEQLIRLVLILTVIPKLIEISYVHAAVGLILTFLFTEAASIIVFSICMNKKDVKTMYKLSYSKSDIKDILNLSIPTVTSRIIGNICYFFEPIILTNILLYKGYSHYFILTEYGAYNAYAISTLTIPSFFISAISLALIPEISKYNESNNTYYVKKRLKEACIYTFIIGLISTFGIFIFRNELLFFLYKTTLGTDYIKLLAPFFILFYFESIFASFMQGVGKARVTLKITIFSGIVKLLFLSILSFLEIGIYGLLIAEIINIVLVVSLNYYYINKYFRH